MVTDFSGVAIEFMTLDRPVIYLDCPAFYNETLIDWGNDSKMAKDDDRFNSGRNYGTIVYPEYSDLCNVVQTELDTPDRLSHKRKKYIDRFLYNPGKGAEAAINTIQTLLNN